MHENMAYLDNNATTRVHPEVIDAMVPLLGEMYGNPSSAHFFGAQVAPLMERARESVAKLIGARESEIVFTSGGTEADNAAIEGVFTALPEKKHLIVSAIEHAAILDKATQLEGRGIAVTRVGVDSHGVVNLDALRGAIREDTGLISIMLANNELGVIQPLAEVSAIARERGVFVHTDAVNAIGKLRVDVEALGVHYMSISAHKFHGPKGVGALYVRRGSPFRPQQVGGAQERNRRGGTLNSAGIVGIGAAAEALLREDHDAIEAKLTALRDRLEAGLRARIPDVHIIGAGGPRLSNTTCACFAHVEAEPLLISLSQAGVCVSSGAACGSGSLEPSHVLTACGVDPVIGQGQIRFSVGRYNTEADIDRALEVLPGIVEKVRAMSGVSS